MAFVDNSLEVFFDLVPTGAVLYAPVFDASGELVDFRFVRLNPAGQRLLGLPAQPPRTFREYYPASVPTGIFDQYRTAYLTGQASTYDVPYKDDGIDSFFRLVAQRSGELLVVNFTDMADLPRSAMEQALRASRAREQAAHREAETQRQRLHAALMQLPASVTLLRGPDHVLELVNPHYAQLFPARTLLGQPFREAIPELAGQGYFELLDHVYESGEPVYQEEAEAWADFHSTGQLEQRYYRTSFQPIRNAQGEVAEVLNFAVDITAQVQARRQVEQLNQALEARVQERTRQLAAAQAATERQRRQWYELFRRAPAAICIFDGPTWVYEFVNPGYQAMFPGRELLGKPLLEALPEVAGQPLMAILHHVYDTGETFEGSAVLVPLARTVGGPIEDIYFDLTYQARYNEAGQIDGFITYAYDVTQQVLAGQQADQAHQQIQNLNQELAAINEELTATNEQLHETNRQLTRTNVDLDTFVYTASHDLKAPITNIESILAALRTALPAAVQQDELVAQLLDLLGQTVGRFQVTIGQLTDLSKLQLAHAGPAEPVNLAAVVEAVRLDLGPAIAAAEAELTVEVAPALVVCFAPANLRSIVYNLLSNAVKYRAPDRPALVRVAATCTGPGMTLEVQDNGLGMSELQQRQLFGLFQRLHTHVEGTGVGLYITKRLVENAGGTIAVRSQPAAGTTFTVTFPA